MLSRYALVLALIFSIASGCAYSFQSGNRKVDREWRRIENQTAGPARCCIIAGATAAVIGLWAWLGMESSDSTWNNAASSASDSSNQANP